MPGIPIVGGGSSSATGPTLLRVRNRFADELGFYLGTTVSTTASNAEAARVAIVNELRDDEMGYPLLGQWLYARTGDQAGVQRRILDQPDAGYQGSKGAVVLSRPFAAALASGDVVEITSPLPVKRAGTIRGLNDFINEGLARIWVEGRLTITGNGTTAYALDSYPWLTRMDQTRGIYDTLWLGADQQPELASWNYRIVTNNVSRTLVTERTYASDETFQLAVLARGDRLVYDGSSWSYVTTPGLLSDTYQCACPEEWAVAFAMVKALQFLTRWVQRDRRLSREDRADLLADILDRRQKWAASALFIKNHEFPKPLPMRAEPLILADPMPVWQ